jgi:hypothetical protein
MPPPSIDHLYTSGDVHRGRMLGAHARRYFFKALGSEPELAGHALAYIKGLFRIERAIKTAPRKKREQVRREQSAPILDTFFHWCDEQAAVALDGTPIAQALGYARNQRAALRRFLDDGRLPLENNISERNLRREVLGRKNWLFLGSDEGARVNTIFVSLLASCQLHGIEPWAYLRDLFCLVQDWPASRILELAPAFWKQTLQQPETLSSAWPPTSSAPSRSLSIPPPCSPSPGAGSPLLHRTLLRWASSPRRWSAPHDGAAEARVLAGAELLVVAAAAPLSDPGDRRAELLVGAAGLAVILGSSSVLKSIRAAGVAAALAAALRLSRARRRPATHRPACRPR